MVKHIQHKKNYIEIAQINQIVKLLFVLVYY